MRTFSTPRAVLLAALAACASIPAAAQCVLYNAQQPQGTIFYDAWPNTQAVVPTTTTSPPSGWYGRLTSITELP